MWISLCLYKEIYISAFLKSGIASLFLYKYVRCHANTFNNVIRLKKTKSLAIARLHIISSINKMPIENRIKGKETKLKDLCELASVELRQQFKPSVY